MPQVTVYRNTEKIDQLEFTRHFCIEVAEQENAIFWKDDDTQDWQTDSIHGLSYTSVQHPYLHVWLQGSTALRSYMLPLLRSDWVLEVEGQRCQEGFYNSIEIIWHEVTLYYQIYRFDFVFEFLEKNLQASLPKPIKT